jgi:membrane-associated PAP2 superfamily phosphatase
MSRAFLITGFLLIACTLLFEYTDLDVILQSYFYNQPLNQWLIDKDNVVLDLLFYSGFKKGLITLAICLLISLVFFYKKPLIQHYRNGLIIVLVSLILVPAFIGELKSITNVPCPKQLQLFGGDYPYVRFLSSYPADFHQIKQAKCFPAGHASGAFALMSLFFLFKTKRNQRIGLSIGLILGWTTGNYKMFIGDHFFSHTLTTMLFAWLIILSIHSLVSRTSKQRSDLLS